MNGNLVNPARLPAQLADHLALWIANSPPMRDARTFAEALLDPARHGPLVDPEYVTGLVALVEQLKRWPAPERPDHSGRVLHIVKHPQRPGTTDRTVDL